MNRAQAMMLVTLLAVVGVLGCKSDQDAAQSASGGDATGRRSGAAVENVGYANLNLPSGSALDVTLGTRLSSESASVGDAWSGALSSPVIIEGRTIAPIGSRAGGTVTGVVAAKRGDRAMLDLGLSWFTVGNQEYRVHGRTASVIAGSTRARNLGAIAAATTAGAVAGHAIGGSGKGTLIGAVVGAGAATGVVSQTRGWQVVLKPGMPFTFNTNEAIAIRL